MYPMIPIAVVVQMAAPFDPRQLCSLLSQAIALTTPCNARIVYIHISTGENAAPRQVAPNQKAPEMNKIRLPYTSPSFPQSRRNDPTVRA